MTRELLPGLTTATKITAGASLNLSCFSDQGRFHSAHSAHGELTQSCGSGQGVGHFFGECRFLEKCIAQRVVGFPSVTSGSAVCALCDPMDAVESYARCLYQVVIERGSPGGFALPFNPSFCQAC